MGAGGEGSWRGDRLKGWGPEVREAGGDLKGRGVGREGRGAEGERSSREVDQEGRGS